MGTPDLCLRMLNKGCFSFFDPTTLNSEYVQKLVESFIFLKKYFFSIFLIFFQPRVVISKKQKQSCTQQSASLDTSLEYSHAILWRRKNNLTHKCNYLKLNPIVHGLLEWPCCMGGGHSGLFPPFDRHFNVWTKKNLIKIFFPIQFFPESIGKK